MSTTLALAALLAVFPTLSQKSKNFVAAGPTVRVYVFTGPMKSVAGFVDADAPDDLQRRSDSVRDIREQIRKHKPGDGIVGLKLNGTTDLAKLQSDIIAVDSVEEADITLEVVVSAEAPSGRSESHTDRTPLDVLFGGVTTATKQELLPTLVTKLRVRNSEYSTDWAVQEQALWTGLAGYIFAKLDKWIQANAAQLSHK